jgi:hypothetical protein
MKPTENLETMLIMALDANAEANYGWVKTHRGARVCQEVQSMTRLLGFAPMMPKKAFALAVADDDRLLSSSVTDLLTHPDDVFGRRSEVMLFDESTNRLKWMGLRRMNARPARIATTGRVRSWYECHWRVVMMDGSSTYDTGIIAFGENGGPVPCRFMGEWFSEPRDHASAILAASIIEDVTRPVAMLATVTDRVSVSFSVPTDDYKEFFADRNGPWAESGRRRPILHWVAKHLRGDPDRSWPVKGHARGVRDFTVDGLSVTIDFNRGARK